MSEELKVKTKEFLDINEQIKELKKTLKELTEKKQQHEKEIKEWMISNEKQQIKSDLGNIVLYNKKVSKGSFTKDIVKEKITNQMGNVQNLDKLTEELFKKETTFEEALKIVK